MSDEPLILEETDTTGVRVLTLNRPRAYNALSHALMAELHAALERAGGDRAVRVLVLRGAGPGFCAGHDLRELRENRDPEFLDTAFGACAQLMLSVVDSPKPVIAAVHGMASAAGCQLVASCDLAVAGRSARFATPGVHIGLFCATPMVALTRSVARKHALEMLLTGDAIDAARAEALALVNRVVDDGEVFAAAGELAARIARHAPAVLAGGKTAYRRQAELPLPLAYEHCTRLMVEGMLADEAAEGIDAFLEKRQPQWPR